VKYYKFDID